MRNSWIRLLIQAIITGLIQIVFINNINFWGNFNPKIFPLYLLLFPGILKPSNFMTLGLVYGFLIDMFSQTYGIGMASSVFICFIRPYIFKLLSNRRDEEETEIISRFKDLNFLIRYVISGLLIFHLVYFIIEMGEFYSLFYIIWKSLLSTTLAVIFYGLYYVIFTAGGTRRERKYSFK